MMRCTTGGVRVTQHTARFLTARVRHEKGRGRGSPRCSPSRAKSRLSRCRRGGVPVL